MRQGLEAESAQGDLFSTLRTRCLDFICILLILGASRAAAQTLQNDFPISGVPYFENTAKVIPPNEACPNGVIAVSAGGTGNGTWETGVALARTLYNPSGNIDTTTVSQTIPLPRGSATRAIATDNQIVRQKDGTLLAVRNSSAWDTFATNAPEWANELISGIGDHQGQRGSLHIYRSTDCGRTWALYSMIDFGTFLNGRYGYPRPQGTNPDGSLRWWIGGGDRTELYACPFTGRVFLATGVISGPYKNIAVARSTTLLLYSKDFGRTWELVSEDAIPNWQPLVMTTTPNGRLFLFQLLDKQPTIYYSLGPVNSPAPPQISPPYAVRYMEDGRAVDNETVIPPSGRPELVDLYLNVFHPSISRISTDPLSSKVRVSYHSVNSSGMQETRIVAIDVPNANQAPVVTPLKAVRAENPRDYSVLYFNFIDPDYLDMPSQLKSNTSMAYWIEAPRVGITDKKYAIRYMIFDGDYGTSCPAYLSVRDSRPRTWSVRQNLGDYMSGGFFWKNNTLNYLGQWVEPGAIRANIVSSPYQPPSGTPRMTLTAVWEQAAVNEVQVYDWTYDDFRRKYDELWNQGWRLHILNNHVLDGQVLYTAVWRPSNSGEVQVYGWNYTDFRRKYDELWNQGWRLHILNNYVLNGQVLYTAVWRPSNSGEVQVYGWNYADFRKKYDELWCDGWRLKIFNAY